MNQATTPYNTLKMAFSILPHIETIKLLLAIAKSQDNEAVLGRESRNVINLFIDILTPQAVEDGYYGKRPDESDDKILSQAFYSALSRNKYYKSKDEVLLKKQCERAIVQEIGRAHV